MNEKITLSTSGARVRGRNTGPARPAAWRLLLVLLLQLLAVGAWAQTTTVTGKISDAKEALPGVSIQVKGTTQGATTGVDGTFSIAGVKPDATLVISFIGYTTREISVNGQTSLSVVLQPGTQMLDEAEVVGVGYGEVRRRDLTGSIGSVNVAELQKAPVTSFEQALAGRVAGVQVTSTDGQPGDAVNIVIRGNNSVNNSNAPLYVIDGFPIENPNNNSINPADIESIDVLKDASATAIYGSRGANGVVIITTKRGKKGPPQISYDGYVGINKVIKRMEVLSPYEYVRLQNDLNPALAAPYFTDGRTLESYRNVKGVDYQNELFKTALFQNHTLSLRGGTDATKYSFSGSLTDQKGVITASGFRRYQGRLTLDQQVGTKLKVGLNVNYADTKQYGTIPRNQTGFNSGNSEYFNLVYAVLTQKPVSSSGDDAALLASFTDPDLAALDNRVNPLYSAQNEINDNYNGNLTANLYLNYDFTKDLSLRVTGGTNLNRGRREIFNNSLTRSGSSLTSQGTNGVNGSLFYTQANDYNNEYALTYNKEFNQNHKLNLLGVYSMQFNNSQSFGFTANRVPNEALGVSGLDEGTLSSSTSATSRFTLQSYTSRINYTLFNKYIFTGSFRVDGSSKFAPANRYGYFPSAAVAWRLGDENFMKALPVISNAKVRASFGSVGNNRVSDFAYLSTITTDVNLGYPFGTTLGQGFAETSLGNPDLKWETTTSFDGGLELGFLKDRIALEVDVYQKKTTDLLLSSALPTSTGFGSSVINVGATQNRGVEFTLNTVNVSNSNFTWNTNFNISFNRNQLVSLNTGQDNIVTLTGSGGAFSNNQSLYLAQVGRPISMFYGYVFDGIYQFTDFDQLANGTYVLKDDRPSLGTVTGAVAGRLNGTRPGDIKYRDLNGDNVIDENDRTIIGDPNPTHTGGFSNNFTWKGFDLNVFFQWSYGNDIFNANRVYLEGGSPPNLQVNYLATYADRWTPTNPSNEIPRAVVAGVAGNVNGTRVFSSRTVEDGSFIRLKTIQLGYNVPALYAKRVGLQGVRVYASAQNLKTWTNYSFYDPEVSTKGFGLQNGYDFSPYPRALVLTAGLNITL
ncbi:TonB-dependent receptor [Hymenobacter sp. M29]|uniref:TonB-dependent receptor n=1 Tax=Hymenobacter mellowenesis TaxID=3063995 RepID=A0ABT9A9Q2_9BACT|nr:TonB-dependent receptor [Hymenobacter sp. M29]MDO7846258.1 TonB-dependent receptor [Hymenobacter sp. M29]